MSRDARPSPSLDGSEDDETRALLPFFVNGSLEPAGRARVQRWIDRSALNGAEWRWHASLAASVRDHAAVARADAGLADLRARLREEAAAAAWPPGRTAPTTRRQPAVRRWLANAWHAFVPKAPRFAYAAVAMQAVALGIVMLNPPVDHERIRGGLVVAPMAAGPYARVLFRSGTDERALRQFLLDERLQIVAGPTVLGEYWLARSRPDDRRPDAWIDALRRAPVVAEVVADDRPPASRD